MSYTYVVLFIICATGLITTPTKATDGNKSVTPKTTFSYSSLFKGLSVKESRQDKGKFHLRIIPPPFKKTFKDDEKPSVVLTKSKSSWYKAPIPLALDDTWFTPVSRRERDNNTVKNQEMFKPEATIQKSAPMVINLLPPTLYTSAQSLRNPIRPVVDRNFQEYIALPISSSPNGSEIHLSKNTVLKYDTRSYRSDNDMNMKMMNKPLLRSAGQYSRFLDPIANEYVDKNEYIMNEHNLASQKIAPSGYLPNKDYGDKRKPGIGFGFGNAAPVNTAQPASFQTNHPTDNSHIQLPRVHTVVIRWNLILT